MKQELRAGAGGALEEPFFSRTSRKAAPRRWIWMGRGARRGFLDLLSVGLHTALHGQPHPGRGLPHFDSREGAKQMSSQSKGFGCKSLINEEKFKEIKIAATLHMAPHPSPHWTLVSSDLSFSLFPPLPPRPFFLPPPHPSPLSSRPPYFLCLFATLSFSPPASHVFPARPFPTPHSTCC